MYIVPSLPLPTHTLLADNQVSDEIPSLLATVPPPTQLHYHHHPWCHCTFLLSHEFIIPQILKGYVFFDSGKWKGYTYNIQSDQFTIYLDEEGLPRKHLRLSWFLTQGVCWKYFAAFSDVKRGQKMVKKSSWVAVVGGRESSVSNETVWDIRKCKC